MASPSPGVAGPPVTVAPLRQHPALVATVAAWYEAEWDPYYGPAGPGDARADLAARTSAVDILPVAYVALAGDGTPVGTVALVPEPVLAERTDWAPCVAALLVPAEHRRRGIATALLAHAAAEARRLGFPRLFLETQVAALVRHGGWEPVGEAQSLRGVVRVYARPL